MSGVFNGQVALVTGGSGGLGRYVCSLLARQGAAVAIGYRNGQDRTYALRDQLREERRTVVTERIDVTDPASVEECVTSVAEYFGRIDIVVNAAGTARARAEDGAPVANKDLAALTPEIWDELMAVNLRGPYLVARAAAPHLRRAAPGRIVNVGSTVGMSAWGADAPYAPSKASVTPLTRFLAASLGPEILVNCVAPGLMEGTLMSSGAPPAYVQSWRDRSLTGATTSIGEVTGAIMQCCRARTMTGQTITIDGGIHLGA
ncbi:MAG: SDR family NAD(P)-dependent oxidoreductase [Pseudooceanicola sp.]